MQLTTSGLSTKNQHRVMVLKIKYKVFNIMFTAKFTSSERSTYERFDNVFKEVVALSASLIHPVNVLVNSKVRVLSQIQIT